MTTDIHWELYSSFLAVLQEGSLSGAARALGLTQPTIGRHIAALEAAFNQTLFIRSQNGLHPTEMALSLRGYAERMHSAAAAMQRAANSQQSEGISGTVRISASEVIGVEVLPPALAQLRRKHPSLKIELVPTNKVQNLLELEADIAVRMTPPRQDLLIARKVGAVELGMFARADYLEQNGAPSSMGELAQHALIGFSEDLPFLRSARSQFPEWSRESFSLRTDSHLAQLALMREGCGIGICQVALARRDARLVRVLPADFSLHLDTWVTMHEDLRHSPRCKVTFDALVECLLAHTA